MRIAIYPGSFNPVHKGHIKIANEALERNFTDRVLIVPTGSYWDKNNLVDLNHRINMLKFYENENIIIETEYNITNSTYESFLLFQKRYPNDELCLVIGADNLISFDKWIEYKKLLEYPFIITERDDYNEEKIKERMKEFNKDNYYIIPRVATNVSSSNIRDSISSNEMCEDIDDCVLNYIKENNLYTKIDSLNKKLNELTDSQLEIVTGGANYNQCLNELTIWLQDNPLATVLDIYNKLKNLCDNNYYDFSEEDKKQAALLLEGLKNIL